MNPNVPLEIFLPPSPDFDQVEILVTNDHNGLNNGVFLVRVDKWSAMLFAAVLSFRSYESQMKLKYNDQSAMEIIMRKVWQKFGYFPD